MAERRRIAVGVVKWSADPDTWTVAVDPCPGDALVEAVDLPPFHTWAAAHTAAVTLRLAYQADGYNVVEEARP